MNVQVKPARREIAPAIVATELTTDTLLALSMREIGAIHVKGYYPVDVADRAASRCIDHPKLGHYNKKYTSSVGRICTPHIDSEWDLLAARKYHDEAVENIQDLRTLFAPHLTPADKIRLQLQEFWPGGANIQRLHGHSCFVGAIRVFRPSSSRFYPHNDTIIEESDAPELAGIEEQMVANMYLRTPKQGGDLQLWLRDPTPEEMVKIRDVEGLLPDEVEQAPLVIHPDAGDLIIFSSRMLHAVTPSDESYRIGMAAFIGCYGSDRPLTYWS
ncbi:2OG-Fe(II) oxygenase [Xanthomonas campestris pv. campestris]|uniref:2OG-Fe(II)-dependent halogenase WelO5 family protein n=1 Tax=Xanthomonas campestris TaxID=339 RepID=UPI0022699B30|nr:2OG-Fe(II) oxygenase [Xanthomonas campestris]MEB1349018.1 2OG-Fe(II) oxygenase [Xanthomonas campestris pv. campestris]